MDNKMQLIIKNATYFTNGGFLTGNILVKDGKIAAITEDVTGFSADQEIDAKGLYVLPGLVDSHVHIREPEPHNREDFYTGTLAAAAGGITTIAEMPLAVPPPYSVENLEMRVKLAEEKCITDFCMYGAAGYENRETLGDLVEAGAVAFKTFLHPAPAGREGEFVGLTVGNDGELYMMLKAAAKTDGRYYFHCENAQIIKKVEEELHAEGVEDFSFHYKSRIKVAETESVSTIIQLAKATGAKVGIVHMSAPEACQLVKEAKAEGLDIKAETCFHYLTFDDSAIDKFGPYAKCNPPLRSKEDVEKLWGYVADGTIDYIGSDHAPFIKDEKEIGMTQGIWKAYSGMPAIEVMLPMMLNEVNQGKLTLERLVELMSEDFCRIFKLYPKKGCIAPGSDGDFTIVDLNKEHTIKIEDMYSKARIVNKAFDGQKVKGAPVYTVVRGKILMDHGKVDESTKGYGEFVKPIK